MENELKITVGKGEHSPDEGRNAMMVTMDLCADSRKEDCPYYVGVLVATDHLSFHQGFCAFKHKK